MIGIYLVVCAVALVMVLADLERCDADARAERQARREWRGCYCI